MEEGRNEQDVRSSSSHEERVLDSPKGMERTNGAVHESEQGTMHEDLYGPWVVVTHRKQGTKNQRSGGTSPGLIKDFVFRGNGNVETGSSDQAEVSNGPTRESKRKLSSSISLDRAQIGAVVQRLGNEPFQQAQSSSARSLKAGEAKTLITRTLFTKNSPRSNTIKGKKEIARRRASQGQRFSASEGRSSDLDNNSQLKEGAFFGVSDGGDCNSEVRPKVSDLFQLRITATSELGSTEGGNSRDFGACFGRDTSHSKPNHGVGQRRAQGSLEEPLFVDGTECKGRMASNFRHNLDRGDKSLMVLPSGGVFTSGGIQDGMGNTISDFSRASAMQCESIGGGEAKASQ